VVALPAGSHGINAGSAARIVVTLSEAKDAEVVPTSAVHSARSGSFVDVVKTGQEERVTVQVGVIGAKYTQIKSGLSSKSEVVLADLSQAVPSSSSSSTSSSSVLGGGGLPSGASIPGAGSFPGAGRIGAGG
jgi:HlyD family secretion protein